MSIDRKYPHILLVNSLSPNGRLMEPVALAQLAAILKRDGYTVEILSCLAGIDGFQRIIKSIEISQAAIVGLTMWSHNSKFVLDACENIKCRFPDVVTVIGGYAVRQASVTLNQYVDVYVIGEGEMPLLQIARKTKAGLRLERIIGPQEFDVSDLPLPARELVDFDQLQFLEELYHPRLMRRRCSFVSTYRGCPHSCSFCAIHEVHGSQIRKRPIKAIMAELTSLVEDYGMNAFINEEDLLFTDKSRVIALCDSIIASPYDFIWTCSGAVHCMDVEILKALKEAGCKYVFLGSISGSDKILKGARVTFTTAHLRSALQAAATAGMPISSSFLVGFPEETLETLAETSRFISEHRRLYWDVGIGIVRPFSGTSLAAQLHFSPGVAEMGTVCRAIDESELRKFINNQAADVDFTF